MVGVLGMVVRGGPVGPAARRFGDRATMIFGLCGGAAGIALIGFLTARRAERDEVTAV